MHLGRKPPHSSLRFLKSRLQGRNRKAPTVGGGVIGGRVYPSSKWTNTRTNKTQKPTLNLVDVAILVLNYQMQITVNMSIVYEMANMTVLVPQINSKYKALNYVLNDFLVGEQHTSNRGDEWDTRTDYKYKLRDDALNYNARIDRRN